MTKKVFLTILPSCPLLSTWPALPFTRGTSLLPCGKKWFGWSLMKVLISFSMPSLGMMIGTDTRMWILGTTMRACRTSMRSGVKDMLTYLLPQNEYVTTAPGSRVTVKMMCYTSSWWLRKSNWYYTPIHPCDLWASCFGSSPLPVPRTTRICDVRGW